MKTLFDMLDMLAVAGFCYAGLACLCLAMERHYADLRGRGAQLAPATRRRLRLGGWSALALALAWALRAEGGAHGTLLWLGSLSACCLLLIVLLPYAARGAARLAWAAAAAGALALGMALAPL